MLVTDASVTAFLLKKSLLKRCERISVIAMTTTTSTIIYYMPDEDVADGDFPLSAALTYTTSTPDLGVLPASRLRHDHLI